MWRCVVLLLLAGVVASARADVSLEEFFRPAPDRGEGLPADGVYPQGRQFPFTLFSVGGSVETEEERQAAMARVKADGFTMMGPQYELNDRVIEDAKAHGLKAVYTVGLPMEFLSDKPLELTPEEIGTRLREQVAAVVERPEIAWWYLQPEEMRYWRGKEMAYLEAATKAIREADPHGRPIWMYDPGHRNAEALAHTAKFLDVCGKGMYTNYSGRRASRIWVRWTIEQELGAIAKANPSAIPIAVPEMFRQPEDDHLDLIPAWVRHDMYLSLISGAKGAVVFSMRQRDGFPAHEAYYQGFAQVARELSGEGGLGQVFLFGEKRDDISIRVIEGPVTLALSFGDDIENVHVEGYPSISHLDVAHGSDRYLFAANSSYDHIRAVVSGLPREAILAKDLFGNEEALTIENGAFELRFAPLEVKGFRFEQVDSE